MIHRDKIKGIKSFIFPRIIKFNFREKTDGHSKVKKNRNLKNVLVLYYFYFLLQVT